MQIDGEHSLQSLLPIPARIARFFASLPSRSTPSSLIIPESSASPASRRRARSSERVVCAHRRHGRAALGPGKSFSVFSR